MIYTTNFSRIRNLPSDIIPISIASKCPSWYDGLEYKKLAPKYDFFIEYKNTHDNALYIKHYTDEVLSKLFVHHTVVELLCKVNNIKGINYSPEIALICYEPKPLNDMSFENIIKNGSKYFCHRHLVAKWFSDNGYDVREI